MNRPIVQPLRVALIIAGNDLRRRLRDRSALLLGIVTPLVMAGLIGMAFGGPGFSATIGVVDEDGSDLSTSITASLFDASEPDLAIEPIDDLATAREMLDDDDLDAVLVIPEGFGSSVPELADGTPPLPLGVLEDTEKPISGGIAESIANGIGARIAASALGVMTAVGSSPGVDAQELAAIVAASQAIDPPLSLELENAGEKYSPVAYFGASMGILFLFFTVGAGARSLILERKEGTLARVRAAPIGAGSIVLGKSIGVFLLGVASLATIWGVTSLVFGARWGDPLAVMSVIVATVLAVSGISTLVTGLGRTDSQADGITSIIAFGFALVAGSFQPPGSLPGVFDTLSRLTPNGWALQAMGDIAAADAGVLDILPALGVLCTIALVTTTIGVRGLRRKIVA